MTPRWYSLFMDNHRGNSRILDAVFTTEAAFIEGVAMHHAILNTCGDECLEEGFSIDHAWQMNLERHCDGMSENDAIKCCEGEKKHFMKDAKKQVALVVKAGMPWTIRSAETFWPIPKKSPKK